MNRYPEVRVKTKMPLIFKQNLWQSRKSFCSECGQEVEMLSADKAASMIGCNSRAIFGWIELGWLHFTETREGFLLVCRNSLGEIITIKN